jgi:hypothetical protein
MHVFAIQKTLVETIWFAVCGMLIIALSFMVLEPLTTQASVSNTFPITQLMTAEISFLATSTGVTMTGSIAGLTGGTATGSTFVVVQTNQSTGYTLDIAFSNSPAMRGNVTGNTAIVDYGTTSEPTFGFFASTSATFAYNVANVPSSKLDQSFKNDGVSCNAGGSYTANTCWMGPSTTPFKIVDSNAAAPSGATTTLQFKVNVPNNPSPGVVSDTYTATATLTATTQ